ncbi:MAG: AraC family transcriptional regulator [Ferruginibacter sp.]|jgi:AraC-like DNA-binding protein
MLQFHYQQGASSMLNLFPHILELCVKKNASIQFQSFPEQVAEGLSVYFINEGKFEWKIKDQVYVLFPGDTTLILPGEKFGNEKEILELGCLSWIQIKVQKLKTGELIPGKWSSLNDHESVAVGKLLSLNNKPVLSKLNDAGRILHSITCEIHNHELGFVTRINQLIDELLIVITRHLTRQNNPPRDFPKVFMNLEEALRKDLSHQWSVEEMAAIAGMGTTLFNEKVKNYTGFTPINYLINIRISEAIKLLKRKDVSITDIALDTGFYSSQHFSTTFKKLTGYTPREFKKNISYTE